LRAWVLPGVELILASFFLFTRIFRRELLPTFDRPEKATSVLSGGG